MVSDEPKLPRRHRLSAKFGDPDLVDRIFDYLVQLHPELGARQAEIKSAVRLEFAGERVYVGNGRGANGRGVCDELAVQVLRIFNGRNASEVARELRISRATVYRLLKQAGAAKA